MRDTYTPQDINPPADGCEPDDNSEPFPDCAECGAPASEAHRKGCSEYAMDVDELDNQERADWRRYVGRERIGGRR